MLSKHKQKYLEMIR